MNSALEHLSDSLAELETVARSLSASDAAQLLNEIESAERVFVAGGGRSGLVARAVGMRLLHMGVVVHIVGETLTPAIGRGDLLWAFSARGSGAALLAQVETAKKVGARVAAIVTASDSPIAKLSDATLTIPIGDTGVPTSQYAGSLFEQSCLLLGDSIAAVLRNRRQPSESEMSARHFNLY